MASIVLLISQPYDRRQARDLLASRYDIVAPEDGLPDEPFDLYIVDGYGLARNWEALQARKTAETPRFLPVLLMAPYRTVAHVSHTVWAMIDALVDTPATVDFFRGRVELLLKIREASVQLDQREALQHARDEALRLAERLEQRVRERTGELNLKNVELQRRADQLAHLASELTLAEQRERNRLATVLHDHLQQLLVAAKFGLDEVAYAASDAEIKKAVGDVRQLLDESIVASRSLTVELSPTILHEAGLAAGLEWLARWMKHKHGLTVQVDTRKDAATDREDIRILLFASVRELLFNVVKHGGTDRAKVSLVRSGEFLEITVSDKGAGFDPEQAGAKEGSKASGLGLFSIRERLELLGGSLQMESAPGRGSRFVLRAPAARSAGEAVLRIEQKRLEAEREEAALVAGGRLALRVLLVDDHKVLRQSMAARLNRAPDIMVVGEAGNGQEAIEKARQMRPDVVLMDFSMPHMDGVEATQRICAELPDTQIIGLSMYEEADRAQAMLQAGAATYLSKGVEFDELLAAIRSVHADTS